MRSNPPEKMQPRWLETGVYSGLFLLLVLARTTEGQAQDFYCVTNNSTIKLLYYIGPGGNVTIPSSINGYPVATIGFTTFYRVYNVTGVTIPDCVTSIEDGISIKDIGGAFSYCTGLTNVTFGSSLTNIGRNAFYSCTNLTSITIPGSVTYIGGSAFLNCTRLTEINVVTLNPAYSSLEGVLFDKGHTTLVQFPGGKAGNYTIPDGVTSITPGAFFWNTNLTSIRFPDSVTSVGDDMFSACSSLAGVTMGNGVTNIGQNAFISCSKLTNIWIPNSVTSVGDGAFAYCSSLANATIGNHVTTIGSFAFGPCPSLTGVTIPDSVTSIGPRAFIDCTNLTQATIGNGVVTIGEAAFNGCVSLTSVVVPDSVSSIGDSAFARCSSLRNLTIGRGVIAIGDSAFYYCTSLTNVTIPDSVTSIAGSAFYNLQRLTSATIGSGVTNIGDYAFFDCLNLATVYFRGNAPSVGLEAFAYTRIVYYLPGTIGWGSTFDGVPTVLWNPQAQTRDGSFGVRQNGFGFNISGTADIPLVVEVSSSVAAQAWLPVESCTLTNGLIYFSDADWTNQPGRFYRIRSP